MLLLFAVLTYGVALWEGLPLAMVVPALFALWAVLVIGDHPANLGTVFVMAGAAAAARRWRGPWWSIPLHVAVVAGSAFVVGGLAGLGPSAPYWQVPLLLGYGTAAYLMALQERQPWVTPAAALYVLAAVWLLPDPGSLVSTLALTGGLAVLGLVLSRKLGRPWSWAPYAVAAGASLFAVGRVVPFEAGSLARKPIPGCPRRIGSEEEAVLREQLGAAPDATVLEHGAWWAEQTGQQLSEATMWRAIRRLGWMQPKKYVGNLW